MSGGLITDTLLSRFKQKLLGVVEKLLAGKQDAGEYVIVEHRIQPTD